MIIEAHAVVKAYGPTRALRGVTAAVDDGEIVAVTGPSGCGKSTLLHVVSGILTPDGGEVRYRGQSMTGWSESRRSVLRRQDFGVLFQFGHLVAELSAVENVALPLLLGGARRRAATTTALGWLDRFGVAEQADKLPGEMSGGQQQRVALARALVTGPRVLFADEPTGALDSEAGEVVLAHLVEAARTQGTSVVLVTHDAAVAACADREIRLRNGVVDEGAAPLGAGGRHSTAGTGMLR